MMKGTKLMFKDRYFIAGILVFLVIYILLIPCRIIMISDDFGYYDSIVKTIQHGTVMASDWLEPTNAFLSLVCWMTYKLTGNFYLSTIGILALCSMLNFMFMFILIKRKLSSINAAIVTLIICTCPVYLVRSVDFLTFIPILTFAFIANYLYEQKIWTWFFITVFIAFSIRQSTIVLLLLPVSDLLNAPGSKIKRIIPGILFFITGTVVINILIKPGYAHLHLSSFNRLLSRMELHTFLNSFFTGFFIFISIIALLTLLADRSFIRNVKVNAANFPVPVFLTILLGGSLMLSIFFPYHIIISTLGIKILNDYPAVFYVVSLISVWVINYDNIRVTKITSINPYLLLGLAYVTLVAIRGIWGDSYFIELFIYGLFFIVSTESPGPILLKTERITANILIISLLLFNLAYAGLFKIYLDVKENTIVSYEQLLRDKKIKINEVSSAPFGYLGWKLFQHYTAHEGKVFVELSKFLNYVESGRSFINFEPVWINRFQSKTANAAIMQNNRLLHSDKVSIGFLHAGMNIYLDTCACLNESLDPNGSLYPLGIDYREPMYPLNNAEWRAFLKTVRSK